METYYRLYAKFPEQKKYKPLDLETGQQVTNLIYATMIPEWKLKWLEDTYAENPEISFKLEKIK
jgi:hypothetical protein